MSDIRNNPPELVFYKKGVYAGCRFLLGETGAGEVCFIDFLENASVDAVLSKWRGKWQKTEFVQSDILAKDIFSKPVLLIGTKFQRTVWKEIAKIPFGQVATYKEIAARIGNPKGSRAVGVACGANPVPIVVPCHRVVASNGIGGFSGGISIKNRLLSAEK